LLIFIVRAFVWLGVNSGKIEGIWGEATMFEDTRTEGRGTGHGMGRKGNNTGQQSGKEQCGYTAQSLWKFLQLSFPNE